MKFNCSPKRILVYFICCFVSSACVLENKNLLSTKNEIKKDIYKINAICLRLTHSYDNMLNPDKIYRILTPPSVNNKYDIYQIIKSSFSKKVENFYKRKYSNIKFNGINNLDSGGFTPLIRSIKKENFALFTLLMLNPQVNPNKSICKTLTITKNRKKRYIIGGNIKLNDSKYRDVCTPIIETLKLHNIIFFKVLANKACVDLNKIHSDEIVQAIFCYANSKLSILEYLINTNFNFDSKNGSYISEAFKRGYIEHIKKIFHAYKYINLGIQKNRVRFVVKKIIKNKLVAKTLFYEAAMAAFLNNHLPNHLDFINIFIDNKELEDIPFERSSVLNNLIFEMYHLLEGELQYINYSIQNNIQIKMNKFKTTSTNLLIIQKFKRRINVFNKIITLIINKYLTSIGFDSCLATFMDFKVLKIKSLRNKVSLEKISIDHEPISFNRIQKEVKKHIDLIAKKDFSNIDSIKQKNCIIL